MDTYMAPKKSKKCSEYVNVVVIKCADPEYVFTRADLSFIAAHMRSDGKAFKGIPISEDSVLRNVVLPNKRKVDLEPMHIEPGALSIDISSPGELTVHQVDRVAKCLQIAIFGKGAHIAIVPEYLGIKLTKG